MYIPNTQKRQTLGWIWETIGRIYKYNTMVQLKKTHKGREKNGLLGY